MGDFLGKIKGGGGYLKTRILAFFQIRKSAENPEISEIGRKMRCNQCRNETIATIAGMAGMAEIAKHNSCHKAVAFTF